MSDYAVQRERMVRDLIAARGVKDERVLAAMRKVPRPPVRQGPPAGPGLRRPRAAHRRRANHFAALHRGAHDGVPGGGAGALGAGDRHRLGLANVKVQVFDGTVGWSEWAPYDRILVAAGAPKVPEPLLDQLAPGGVLLIPEGSLHAQRLVVYRKSARGDLRRRESEDVAFVPLVGRHGWKEKP